MIFDEVGDTSEIFQKFSGAVDDPLFLIIFLGSSALVLVGLLLRFSFYVMKRADQKSLKMDQMR